MTRTALRDALTALAAATRMSDAGRSQAAAPRKSVNAYQAEIAMDAVLKPEALRAVQSVAQDVVLEAVQSPQQTANGQNRRWWQDYGVGRHCQVSVQNELSQ